MFLWCFTRDELENITSNPLQNTIVNTDPSYKKEKHWLLIYFNDNGVVEFFDSLGYDINYYHSSIKRFVNGFSDKYMLVLRCRLQPINSNLCSDYCLYYAYCKCQGLAKKKFNIVDSI